MPVDHYENFPVASLLLPAPLRKPVEAIYRFARSADDIADEGFEAPEARLARLALYQGRLAAISAGETPAEPMFRDLAQAIREHRLPMPLFHDLLDAFCQDVTTKRYATYSEVLDYCRRSANPVGRLLLHLFKRTSEPELRQSDAICTALQLVNFWQDVDVDFTQDDRIYLPREDMARFAVTQLHLLEKTCDGAWVAMMKFQVERTRALMQSGAPLGRALPGRIGLEIRATVAGGLRILEKIEKAGYDVFRRRPVLRALDWPLLLLRAA
ncbi:MAG TPA: squalene synthase HpnC [Burkholderiales bacterium]|nr:squalene synthase HpnC [Burkholderiales bacterium]